MPHTTAFHIDRHPLIIYVKAPALFQGAAIGGVYLRTGTESLKFMHRQRCGISTGDFRATRVSSLPWLNLILGDFP
jgi:hypothetical protein